MSNFDYKIITFISVFPTDFAVFFRNSYVGMIGWLCMSVVMTSMKFCIR